MSQFENIIFGKKKFSDVLEEIYNNQKKKDQQVTALISELKPLISDIGDATLVVPLIKEYMEISVKNDDILIKMAALAQRAMATVTSDGSLTISDEEKEQLLSAMNELKGDK
jgi:2',3'-cyclic-nucleotide 2'-phosphodiesterase (5'-nucleotidase family)